MKLKGQSVGIQQCRVTDRCYRQVIRRDVGGVAVPLSCSVVCYTPRGLWKCEFVMTCGAWCCGMRTCHRVTHPVSRCFVCVLLVPGKYGHFVSGYPLMECGHRNMSKSISTAISKHAGCTRSYCWQQTHIDCDHWCLLISFLKPKEVISRYGLFSPPECVSLNPYSLTHHADMVRLHSAVQELWMCALYSFDWVKYSPPRRSSLLRKLICE